MRIIDWFKGSKLPDKVEETPAKEVLKAVENEITISQINRAHIENLFFNEDKLGDRPSGVLFADVVGGRKRT